MENKNPLVESELWKCSNCENEIDKSNDTGTKMSGGELVCAKCAEETFECADCSRRYFEGDDYTVRGGDYTVCEGCFDEYSECSSCGYVTQSDNMHWQDCCDSNFCSECYCECDSNNADIPYRPYSKNHFVGDVLLAKDIKDSRLVGIELEVVDGNPDMGLREKLDSNIGVSDDGSLSGDNAIELQTPPASADRLEDFIDNATKALRHCEYSVNRTCGLHIHIDSKDIKDNPAKAIKLFNTYYTLEPIIYAMLPKRRRGNSYLMPLSQWINEEEYKKIVKGTRTKDQYFLHKNWYKNLSVDQIKRQKNKYPEVGSRYHGFNIHSLLALGHIELRYHDGTTNAKKIKNWINFNLFLMNWATKNYKKLSLDVINSVPQDKLDKKIDLFYRLLDVPAEIKEYVSGRVERFSDTGEGSDEGSDS